MSSDFESLSCDETSHHYRRSSSNPHSSGSFDSLDDLVAEQDARLLRRLPLRDSSESRQQCRHHHQHDREDDYDDSAALYGYREYGVTGQPWTSAHPRLPGFLMPRNRSSAATTTTTTAPSPPSERQSTVVHVKTPTASTERKSEEGAEKKQGSLGGKRDTRLTTLQPTADLELPPPPRSSASSRNARVHSKSMPGKASVTPPLLMPRSYPGFTIPEDSEHKDVDSFLVPLCVTDVAAYDMDDEEGRRGHETRPRYRSAASVDVDKMLAQQQQQQPSQTWRATCPPDSGEITPTASAGTLTASVITERSTAMEEREENLTQTEVGRAERKQQPTSMSTPAIARSRGNWQEAEGALQQPLTLPEGSDFLLPPYLPPCSDPALNQAKNSTPSDTTAKMYHDADGFYRTRLLEESTDTDSEKDNSDPKKGKDAGAEESKMLKKGEDQQGRQHIDVPALAAATAPAITSHGALTNSSLLSQQQQHLPTLPPSFPPVSSAESLLAPTMLHNKLTTAREELDRVAAALPRLTAVHFLSLVITVLVPINVLCLDVIALGWIRCRVDTRYRLAMNLLRHKNSSSNCGGGGVFTSGGSLDVNRAAAAATHVVPSLCAFVLWLMVPNGLLVRIFLLPYPHGTKSDVTTSPDSTTKDNDDADSSNYFVLAVATLYSRLRHRAPQLEVMERYIRYAFLWVMVHAVLPAGVQTVSWLESWMPAKAHRQPEQGVVIGSVDIVKGARSK